MNEIAARRLISQGLARPALATPAEVVRWLGAVQAQEYAWSLWAIGCRLPQATEREIERAIAERAIVRTWPMRGTIHFVPAEDARWMVALLATRRISRYRSIYGRLGLDDATLARARDVVGRALAGGQRRRRPDLYALLAEAGIATARGRGLQILGRLAHEGMICIGPREGAQATFVLLEEWVPQGRALAGEEAVAEVILRYFRSHGPATARDFAWWSGLTLAETRAGLAAVRSQLIEETIAGTTYWLAKPPTGATVTAPDVRLLPPFDEYLVSYKERTASLEPGLVAPWLFGDAISSPILVVDGRVLGPWRRKWVGGGVALAATSTRPLTDAERAAFAEAARRYGEYLRLPATWSVDEPTAAPAS